MAALARRLRCRRGLLLAVSKGKRQRRCGPPSVSEWLLHGGGNSLPSRKALYTDEELGALSVVLSG